MEGFKMISPHQWGQTLGFNAARIGFNQDWSPIRLVIAPKIT